MVELYTTRRSGSAGQSQSFVTQELSPAWLPGANRWLSAKVVFLAGALLFVLGFGINDHGRRRQYHDLAWPLQLGRMVMAGEPAFDPAAVMESSREYLGFDLTGNLRDRQMYLPSTGIALLPLATLPWKTARAFYFFLAYIALVSGLWKCFRVFASQLPSHWRLLAVGLMTCMASVRWNFTLYQIGPLVVWATCHYVTALKAQRGLASVCWGLLGISLKVTLGLPFLGVALALRRFRWATMILLLFVALNLVGFARTGGAEAFRQLRGNQAYMTSVGFITNTPDPHVEGAPPRIDGEFLLNGIVSAPQLNHILVGVLSLGVVGWLFLDRYRWANLPPDTLLRLFTAILTPLGLFAVYHHHYDALVLLVPVALLVTSDVGVAAQKWKNLYIATVVVYSSLYAVRLGSWAEQIDVSFGVLVKILGAASVTLALGAALQVLSLAARENSRLKSA